MSRKIEDQVNSMVFLRKIGSFLKSGLWQVQMDSLGKLKRWGITFLKVTVFSYRKLARDQLFLRAPALAFYSLFSVVPLVALAFGVAKGFGLQDILRKQFQTQVGLPGEVENLILDFAQNTLENAKGGLMAGLGLLFLFVSVALIFSTMEGTFNQIWGVKKSRRLTVKIRDYFSMVFIGTILLLVSVSLTVAILNMSSVFPYLNKIVSLLVGLLPFIIIWLLFAFLIMFMPNRKVTLKAGLIAGIVSGTLYQLFLNFYIRLQVTVSVYNAIYGSFAALPLFLLWLQVSWICLLYGAEISYAYTNVNTMGPIHDPAGISIRTRKVFLLRIVHHIVKRFGTTGADSPTADQIARELVISVPTVQYLLGDLLEEGIITETIDNKADRSRYQPGVSPDELTVYRVLKMIEEHGVSGIADAGDRAFQKIEKILARYDRKLEKSRLNVKVRDLD